VQGVLLLAAGAAAPACGSDDGGKGASYCSTLEGRQRQCGVLSSTGRTNCVNYDDAAEPCETACLKQASCVDVIGQSCGQSTLALSTCFARCVGLEPVTCKDGSELPGYARCDGQPQCLSDADGNPDDSDEAGCDSTGYQCRTVDERVPFTAYCDGAPDCSDGSDETPDCKVVMTCSDGTQVLAAMLCDGTVQCTEGEDEPSECATRMCN
jgi:hypothetical protein